MLLKSIVMCAVIAASFAEPPPSPLYGAPNNDLQAPSGGDFSGTFIQVPVTHFQAPALPVELTTAVDTYQAPPRMRNSYSQQQQHYQQHDTYSVSPPQQTYGVPKVAPLSQSYGPPPTTYLPPQKPTNPAPIYIAPPTSPKTVYLPPVAPRNTYGPPAQQPSRQYGAPQQTAAIFPSQNYGAPARSAPAPSSSYGAPAQDAGYGYGGNDDYNVSQPKSNFFQCRVKKTV